jgi:hypothetical protein
MGLIMRNLGKLVFSIKDFVWFLHLYSLKYANLKLEQIETWVV